MPVTIKPSDHGASSWTGRANRQVTSPEQLLQRTTTDDRGRSSIQPRGMLQSSFADGQLAEANMYAAKNGFVYACLEAYNMHHRLVLRPDDVWLAILMQQSIYVNTHA